MELNRKAFANAPEFELIAHVSYPLLDKRYTLINLLMDLRQRLPLALVRPFSTFNDQLVSLCELFNRFIAILILGFLLIVIWLVDLDKDAQLGKVQVGKSIFIIWQGNLLLGDEPHAVVIQLVPDTMDDIALCLLALDTVEQVLHVFKLVIHWRVDLLYQFNYICHIIFFITTSVPIHVHCAHRQRMDIFCIILPHLLSDTSSQLLPDFLKRLYHKHSN